MAKLPVDAIAQESDSVVGRTVVKIPHKMGWEIAQDIARETDVSLKELAETCSLNVYCDHVMVDTCCLE